MGLTSISWTATVLPDGTSYRGFSFNPWIGCTKVSAGCANCYAERDNDRFHWVKEWGSDGERRRTSMANWDKVLDWERSASKDGVRRKVFCASLADVFEDRSDLAPLRFVLLSLMELCRDLDWLVLTKRPENVNDMVPPSWRNVGAWPKHIWIGTTCENQEMANKRIPELLKIPAAVRFISVEPMLGSIDLLPDGPKGYRYDANSNHVVSRVYDRSQTLDGIDWVICGGESGPNARPMNLDWARDLRDQCLMASIPFFFKQVGGTKRIDGHWGGNRLDGELYQQFPKGEKQ